MKSLKAILSAALALACMLTLYGCRNADNSIFVADKELQAQADAVAETLGPDRRFSDYLSLREGLLKYNTTTRPGDVKKLLETAKKRYSFIDSGLSLDMGVGCVNEQLFNALVMRSFYDKRTLDEVLLASSDRAVSLIKELGYKLSHESYNDSERITTEYYFVNDTVYDELNYCTVNTLKNGAVVYMSVPVSYEQPTEEFMESYSAMSADERKTVFSTNLERFANSANVEENPVMQLLYSEEELNVLGDFLQGLDIGFLDQKNIAKEEEAYSNRQIPVELGNTRFILRVTFYGIFMDVIQNKDYYNGSFYKDLSILRRAYLGEQDSGDQDGYYYVIGA